MKTAEDWKDAYYEQQALHTEATGMLGQERDGYKAKAQVCMDLHAALGVEWGHDPYARIRELKERGPYAVALEKAARNLIDAADSGIYPDPMAAREATTNALRELRAALAKNPSPSGNAAEGPLTSGAAAQRVPVASTGPVGLGPVQEGVALGRCNGAFDIFCERLECQRDRKCHATGGSA